MSPNSNDISLNDIKNKIIITNSKEYNIQQRIGTTIIYNITSFKEFKKLTFTSKNKYKKYFIK